MQLRKKLGILLIVCFLMSVTASAVSADQQNNHDSKPIIKAKDDSFKFNFFMHSGNVLSNDVGKDLKVIRVSNTEKGGKVDMNSKGKFSYKPPSNSRQKIIHDSFAYMIRDKFGKTGIAKVTITYEFKKMGKNNYFGDN